MYIGRRLHTGPVPMLFMRSGGGPAIQNRLALPGAPVSMTSYQLEGNSVGGKRRLSKPVEPIVVMVRKDFPETFIWSDLNEEFGFVH